MTIVIPHWALISLLILGSIGVLGWSMSGKASGYGAGFQTMYRLGLAIIIVLVIWLIYFALT
jgi:hypothetical protein